MPQLENYQEFGGYHWETGCVQKILAYQGVKAPHTDQPYSEAFLLGVSGGITFGYFTFAYTGYDPQCNILTRNTFDPLDRLLSRLGVTQTVARTASACKAEGTLIRTLEEGSPAMVWADMWSLSYNGFAADEEMWGMMPVVVYGYDRTSEQVLIADRAQVPLKIPVDDLAVARGRVKKIKHQLLTLDLPDPDKVRSAVIMGLWDCVKLFTEKPPKGSKNNFGLTGLAYWAKMLTQPKGRSSWETLFPAGPKLYAGLTSAYTFAFLFGKGLACDAERGLYADFLDEAALLLQKPILHEVSEKFRDSAANWHALPGYLLPDAVPPLAEARNLMWRRHEAFLQQGGEALEEMRRIDRRLAEIRQSMDQEFPLEQSDVEALRATVAEQLMQIHSVESEAVYALRSVLAEL